MSRAQTPNPLTVRDAYRLSSNRNSAFGIEGYSIPKTINYYYREHKFSVASAPDISKSSNEPDPTKYAESKDANFKRFWETSNGKFLKGKKKIVTHEQADRSKSIPGPGAYFKENKKASKDDLVKGLLYGRFDKSEKTNFITDAQHHAQGIPSGLKYNPSDHMTKRKSFACKMGKPATAKPSNRNKVGPGAYYDGIVKSKKHTLRTSQSFSVPKSNPPSVFEQKAKQTKVVPGVGAYKDADVAFAKNIIIKRNRCTTFFPYKLTRFSEEAAKSKQWIPGPGSYNIGPPARNKD